MISESFSMGGEPSVAEQNQETFDDAQVGGMNWDTAKGYLESFLADLSIRDEEPLIVEITEGDRAEENGEMIYAISPTFNRDSVRIPPKIKGIIKNYPTEVKDLLGELGYLKSPEPEQEMEFVEQ